MYPRHHARRGTLGERPWTASGWQAFRTSGLVIVTSSRKPGEAMIPGDPPLETQELPPLLAPRIRGRGLPHRGSQPWRLRQLRKRSSRRDLLLAPRDDHNSPAIHHRWRPGFSSPPPLRSCRRVRPGTSGTRTFPTNGSSRTGPRGTARTTTGREGSGTWRRASIAATSPMSTNSGAGTSTRTWWPRTGGGNEHECSPLTTFVLKTRGGTIESSCPMTYVMKV